jgi:ABC-type amino acid transport substrate-binding protein
MTQFRSILLAAAFAAGLSSAPALADKPRDADKAFENTQRGRSMPLPQLERRVLPFMGGADYLGPELNDGVTRMKFMRNGRVIWVDVDGHGRIIRRSGD